jgi:hypothetical protein
LQASDTNAELEIEIKLKKNHQKICLQATYFYQSHPYNQSAINVQLVNMAQNEVVSAMKLKVNQDHLWQIEDVVFEGLTATDYKIVIKVPETVSIGGITFCNVDGKK